MMPSIELPAEITGPSAWYGPQVATRIDWIHTLGDQEIAEIELATRRLEESGFEPAALRRDTFPLPTLSPRLSRILAQVLDDRGFVLLRGLPVHEWGHRKSAVAFLGLGLHLGNLRSQNAQGHLLGHVRDQGLSSKDPNVRIYQTRERQNYHTDSCDVVGLLCLQPARAGGLSSLVSTVTIFNELRRKRPDLARVLFEPIETDRRGEVPPGQRPYFRIPVCNWHEGLLTTIYHRSYIESARRFADVPALTAAQTEALDAFDGLANDPALHFFMEFRAGDVQLVHNHTLLHDRTAFEDWPEPERRRHLLRLWLAPAEARPLPAVFAERYGSLTPGNRGGIHFPDTSLTVPWQHDG
jgi:Taurine catabolism dioxygenase TauD, TfdA family